MPRPPQYREPMSTTDSAAPTASAASPQPESATAAPGARTEPVATSWQRPPPDASGRQADLIAAIALFAVSLLTLTLYRAAGVFEDAAHPAVSILLMFLLTAPLVWRRRFPAAVLIVVSLAKIVSGELEVPEFLVVDVALFLALYTVGAWAVDRSRGARVRALVIAVMFLWLLSSFFRVATDPPDGESVAIGVGMLTPLAANLLIHSIVNILYFGGAVWFGNHAWNAARTRALVEQRASELQAERALVEAQAVTIERMRLARELHDAVAHHVSLIGIQAAAARTLLATDSAKAAGQLESVEDSARDAIEELHSLLRMLREDDDGSSDAVGSLGVQRIPGLIDDARDTGITVEFQTIGEPVQMRPLASLNLYRIAQESLTNVRKHAGSNAKIDVRLRYLDHAVELEVADDGGGRRRRLTRHGAGGLGLIGMRERVESDGGTLHTGPRREGGFLVRAHVPFNARESSQTQDALGQDASGQDALGQHS